MKSIASFLLLLLISCGNTKSNLTHHSAVSKVSDSITYGEFKPNVITDYQLDGYQVDDAFEFETFFVLSAYAEGDLETSENPVNWGDRLMLIKNKSILFESKPVGDVYLYEPHFYGNSKNARTIIICQLAYEYYFGGDVFLLEDGEISFLGNIDIDGPDSETPLTDIVQISENDETLNFHFKSDSLNFKPGNEDVLIPNNNIHYSYNNEKWLLNNK